MLTPTVTQEDLIAEALLGLGVTAPPPTPVPDYGPGYLGYARNMVDPTGRIRLRPLSWADHPNISRILARPETWEQGFHDGPNSMPPTRDLRREFIRTHLDTTNRIPFAIDLPWAPAIGMAAYQQINRENARVEIGRLLLHPDHWGQGYMQIVLRLMLKNAFEQGFRRVQAAADANNQRSITALTRAGFISEGVRRNFAVRGDGTSRDVHVLAVTEADTELLDSL